MTAFTRLENTRFPETGFYTLLDHLTQLPSNQRRIDIQTSYEMLLRLSGQTILDIVRRTLSSDSINLYYWPGYDSIYLDPMKAERITFHLIKDDPTSPQCGIGFKVAGSPPTVSNYANNRSVLWFDRVLARTDNQSGFSPGSTHRWLTQKGLRLVNEARPKLLVLDVHANAGSPPKVLENGIMKVFLNNESPYTYGQQLAEVLNNPHLVVQKDRWPYSDQPFRSDYHDLRVGLYDIWLNAVFETQKRTPDHTWQLIARQFRELKAYQMAYEITQPEPSLPDDAIYEYSHWYSLAIEPIHSTDSELGTVMLFTSQELPEECLFECQNRAMAMYRRWRDAEEHFIRIETNEVHGARILSLSRPNWSTLRTSLFETCDRLGLDSSVGHALWAHHLPGGGEDNAWPPGDPRTKEWIKELRSTAGHVLTELWSAADAEDTINRWPDYYWYGLYSSETNYLDRPWLMPPVRALASFDEAGQDLTKLIHLLDNETSKIAEIQCDSAVISLEHDYLWFNALVLADGLYQLAACLSGEVRKRKKQSCTGAIVRWYFEESSDDNGNTVFNIRVWQYLKFSSRVGFKETLQPFPLPNGSSAIKEVSKAYRNLESIGAQLSWSESTFVIRIGPAVTQNDILVFGSCV